MDWAMLPVMSNASSTSVRAAAVAAAGDSSATATAAPPARAPHRRLLLDPDPDRRVSCVPDTEASLSSPSKTLVAVRNPVPGPGLVQERAAVRIHARERPQPVCGLPALIARWAAKAR